MEIVDLVCGGGLPPEESQSYMGKRSPLRSASRKVFSLHKPVVGGRCAEGNAVAFVVGAHTGEIRAPRDPPLEMVDV